MENEFDKNNEKGINKWRERSLLSAIIYFLLYSLLELTSWCQKNHSLKNISIKVITWYCVFGEVREGAEKMLDLNNLVNLLTVFCQGKHIFDIS